MKIIFQSFRDYFENFQNFTETVIALNFREFPRNSNKTGISSPLNILNSLPFSMQQTISDDKICAKRTQSALNSPSFCLLKLGINMRKGALYYLTENDHERIVKLLQFSETEFFEFFFLKNKINFKNVQIFRIFF